MYTHTRSQPHSSPRQLPAHACSLPAHSHLPTLESALSLLSYRCCGSTILRFLPYIFLVSTVPLFALLVLSYTFPHNNTNPEILPYGDLNPYPTAWGSYPPALARWQPPPPALWAPSSLSRLSSPSVLPLLAFACSSSAPLLLPREPACLFG